MRYFRIGAPSSCEGEQMDHARVGADLTFLGGWMISFPIGFSADAFPTADYTWQRPFMKHSVTALFLSPPVEKN